MNKEQEKIIDEFIYKVENNVYLTPYKDIDDKTMYLVAKLDNKKIKEELCKNLEKTWKNDKNGT